MIRAAKFGDVPGMLDVLREAYATSFYAGRATLDEREANRSFVNAIQRLNGRGEAGTFVQVIDRNGKVEGFIIGVQQRVYQVAHELSVTDVFWLSTKRAGVRDRVRLMWAMTEWARARKNVIEVVSAISGAAGDAAPAEAIMEKLGFERWGGLWRMNVSRQVEGVAA